MNKQNLIIGLLVVVAGLLIANLLISKKSEPLLSGSTTITPAGTIEAQPTTPPSSIKPINANQAPPGAVKIDPVLRTKIQFAEEKFNFGTIKTGDKVTHVFRFKNVGNKPLTIVDAKASCGCTTPHFTTDPVLPGKTGEIQAVFDSAHKSGAQTKTITVTANTDPEQTILTLTGEVIGDPNAH